jgi:nucleotide-binding universal stress UspA family protein
MHLVDVAELRCRRALITLDGSMVAEAILPAFLRVAYPLGLDIVLIRVVPTVPLASEDPGHAQDSAERMKADAEAYLRAVAATLSLDGLRVDTVVRTGEAPQEIIAVAQEVRADLIAMTTHGRTGLSRLLFGSVAEAVLRAAPVPVFIVRASPTDAATRAA